PWTCASGTCAGTWPASRCTTWWTRRASTDAAPGRRRRDEMRARSLAYLALLVIVVFPGRGWAADPGVKDSEIVVGQGAAMTGPVAHLGTSTRDGFQMTINEANAAGGVHGRKIRLIAYDDAGSPQEALAAVRRLIYQDQVFALVIGSTSGATLPVIPLI